MVEILPDCQLTRYWMPNNSPPDTHFEALVAKGFDKYECTRYQGEIVPILDDEGDPTDESTWQILVTFDMNDFWAPTDECSMEIEGCELVAEEISDFGWTGVDDIWSFVLDTSQFSTI